MFRLIEKQNKTNNRTVNGISYNSIKKKILANGVIDFSLMLIKFKVLQVFQNFFIGLFWVL